MILIGAVTSLVCTIAGIGIQQYLAWRENFPEEVGKTAASVVPDVAEMLALWPVAVVAAAEGSGTASPERIVAYYIHKCGQWRWQESRCKQAVVETLRARLEWMKEMGLDK